MRKFRLTGYRVSAMSDLIPTLESRYESLVAFCECSEGLSLGKKTSIQLDYTSLRTAINVLKTYFYRDFLQDNKAWSSEFDIPTDDFTIGILRIKHYVDTWSNSKIVIITDYAKKLYKSYYVLIRGMVDHRLEWDKQFKESDIYGEG